MELVIYREHAHCTLRDIIAGATIIVGPVSDVIERALATLSPGGGVVRFLAGEFQLERPIVLPARCAVRGAGRSTRLLAPPAASGLAAILCDQADGAEIFDLSLIGSETSVAAGVVLDACGDSRVSGVFAKGFSRFGFSMRNRSFLCRLEHCVAAACGQAGFHFFELAKDGRGGDYVPNQATGCMAYGGHVGFEAENALVLNLIGCSVYQSKSHGFYLHRHSNSVLLSGCRTYQVSGHGALVHDSNELNISSSIFCWTREHGIVLRKVSWGTLSGNNVIDPGVRAPDGGRRSGIVLSERTEGMQVTGNALFSWGDQVPMACGVIEDDTCRNNNVQGNNLNFYRDGGFVMKGEGSHAHGNLAVEDPAYRGNPKTPCPDFTEEALKRFIAGI